MPESLTAALERNLLLLEQSRELAAGLEGDMDRAGAAASRIGDGIADGLGRLTRRPTSAPLVEREGGGAGSQRGSTTLFDASGRPVLTLGELPSRSGGAGGGGGGGGSSRTRIGESNAAIGPDLPGSRSGGAGGSAATGGGFERVSEASRATTAAVRTLDSRSSQLQGAMLGQLTAIRERLDRISDLGVLSRAD